MRGRTADNVRWIWTVVRSSRGEFKFRKAVAAMREEDATQAPVHGDAKLDGSGA